mmetsp:Transcript_36974/g.115820  ORF Transcript_36974/g.115820 Transcript_36974/m.115820 type:complete len:202 (-) Transcript_36974:1335-1940(-)
MALLETRAEAVARARQDAVRHPNDLIARRVVRSGQQRRVDVVRRCVFGTLRPHPRPRPRRVLDVGRHIRLEAPVVRRDRLVLYVEASPVRLRKGVGADDLELHLQRERPGLVHDGVRDVPRPRLLPRARLLLLDLALVGLDVYELVVVVHLVYVLHRVLEDAPLSRLEAERRELRPLFQLRLERHVVDEAAALVVGLRLRL